MSDELVSVIIPTYYRNDRLREAIRSARDQTYGNVEIIVVDDSGERHAEPIVTAFDEVEYVGLEEHREANGARNAGYRQSSGDYIQFLDDDDQMKERKLEKQVALLSSRDDTGVVYCGVESESGAVHPNPENSGDVLRSALRFDLYPCVTSTMLTDEDLLSQVMPLRVRPGSDDLGFMIELATRTKFDFVDEPLVHRLDLDDSRCLSVGAAIGREQILDEYADLYHKYPESLRRSALADTYALKGRALLRHNYWSAGAIVAFTKECVYSGYDPRPAVRALSSVFGRPGLAAVLWASRNLGRRLRSTPQG